LKQWHIVYETVLWECRRVNPSTLEDWRRGQLLKISEVYKPENIYNAD
jgi:hypothetical protein